MKNLYTILIFQVYAKIDQGHSIFDENQLFLQDNLDYHNFQIQYNITQHVAISGPVLEFRIIDELGSIKELNQEWPGMIRPKLEWITNKV